MFFLPPQHGKSETISKYFSAWYMMTHPDDKIILTSYGDDFAASWGRKARDVVEEYGPRLGVNVDDRSGKANQWGIKGREGEMITAGIGGRITGKGAEIGIIDDPVKNAEEAASETMQLKTWDWYLSTFCSRIHDGGAIILIQTRWNELDLAGRILEHAKTTGEKWTVVSLPAIAEEDEYMADGFWQRRAGEALCPSLYSLSTLKEIQNNNTAYWWSALYQQRPYAMGGGMFKRDVPGLIVDEIPPHCYRVRAWDLAANGDPNGKQTAGVKLAKSPDGIVYIEDVVAGNWLPGDRDKVIAATADLDGPEVEVRIEIEPGSGGIAQVDTIIKALSDFVAEGEKVTGSKEIRADAAASAWQNGKLKILRADWNTKFIHQCEVFPTGTICDMVDGLSLGYNYLSTKNIAPPDDSSRYEYCECNRRPHESWCEALDIEREESYRSRRVRETGQGFVGEREVRRRR